MCLVTEVRRGFRDPAALLCQTADADPMLRDRFAGARLAPARLRRVITIAGDLAAAGV